MSDTRELTAWEEIGGAARRELSPPVAASLPVAARRNDTRDLVPVSREEFFVEVAPCLTLAAGVGMSQEDQDAWLEAAYQALEGIPIALLERGAAAAMKTADHPSKIVPAITAAIDEDWRWRREHRQSVRPPAIEGPRQPRSVGALMDARGKPMTQAEADALNAHLERLGSPSRYRPDGTKYRMESVS